MTEQEEEKRKHRSALRALKNGFRALVTCSSIGCHQEARDGARPSSSSNAIFFDKVSFGNSFPWASVGVHGVYLVNLAIFGSKIGLRAHFNPKIKSFRALLG